MISFIVHILSTIDNLFGSLYHQLFVSSKYHTSTTTCGKEFIVYYNIYLRIKKALRLNRAQTTTPELNLELWVN
jgi:hypothetical protein